MKTWRIGSGRVSRSLAKTTLTIVAACFASPLVASAATAEQPHALELASLSARPAVVRLGGKNRRQQFVVTANRVDGSTADVTHYCRVTVMDDAVARVEKAVVTGVGNGRTKIRICIGATELYVPIVVEDYETYPPVYFATDVIPLVT